MPRTYPLTTRDLNAPIAYVRKPIEGLKLSSGPISTRVFLQHVHGLAEQLEYGQHAINICVNRYLFLVGFCAAIVKGHSTLLPPNKIIITQDKLAESYKDCYVLHDGGAVTTHLPQLNLRRDFQSLDSQVESVPDISEDHIAAIAFTSGSTGQSKPNLKSWHTLYRSTEINYRHMVPSGSGLLYQLATVPAQHMWGFETSVLFPLFHEVCMSDVQPLFPEDIFENLRSLPKPLLLVSTPTHLRALSLSHSEVDGLKLVLSATSPLTKNLAREIETLFSAELREVYGCSEVGSMAIRRTAKDDVWERFLGLTFTKQDEGTVATAEHLPNATVLQDDIEAVDERRFVLAGRSTDLIKIAGNRASLLDINQVLLSFAGIEDGVIFDPIAHNQGINEETVRLCAIVALRKGYDKESLSGFLRKNLDHAFIPRPIYFVDKLPRESNGKLPQEILMALHTSLSRK